MQKKICCLFVAKYLKVWGYGVWRLYQIVVVQYYLLLGPSGATHSASSQVRISVQFLYLGIKENIPRSYDYENLSLSLSMGLA